MNLKRIPAIIGSIVFVSVALLLQIGPASGITTTTTTVTIIGWLVPDTAHFANTLIIFIFPLAGMVVLSMMPMMFHRKGDSVIYFALFGLFLGAIASDLSTNAASTNATPFAVIIVAAILLFLWWWNS